MSEVYLVENDENDYGCYTLLEAKEYAKKLSRYYGQVVVVRREGALHPVTICYDGIIYEAQNLDNFGTCEDCGTFTDEFDFLLNRCRSCVVRQVECATCNRPLRWEWAHEFNGEYFCRWCAPELDMSKAIFYDDVRLLGDSIPPRYKNRTNLKIIFVNRK